MASPATKAADAAQNAGSGTFPPFAAESFPSQLFWLALTFGFLYFFMAKVVVPGVGGLIAERSARIAKDLDEAAAAKTKAEAAGVAYEQALSDARAKAQGIAQSTRDKVNASSDAKRKTVETELAARIAASEATIQTAKTKAMSNVEGIASDAAAAIVQRLTGIAASTGDIAAAVKSAMKV
jgi:F-type H+-transporting ATPase subunit b